MAFVARQMRQACFLSDDAHPFFCAKDAKPVAVRFPEFRVESGNQFTIVHHFPGLGCRGCWNTATKCVGGPFALEKIEPCAQIR